MNEKLIDVIHSGKMEVRYPSGQSFMITGDLFFPMIPGEKYANIAVSMDDLSKSIVMLDPRAIITSDGKHLYHPRTKLDLMPAWVTEWLYQHPEWK